MNKYLPGCYYGHSANEDGAGVPELLSDHLERVAKLAAKFAAPFDAGDQAYAAGQIGM